MFVNWFGVILFMVGIILIGLGLTYLAGIKEPMLLAGIVITGGGLAFSSLFKES